MILLCLFLVLGLCLLIKICLCFFVNKHGKISYDGFNALGFAYDSDKEIFYSTKNAWQRNFGYTHFYDVAAPFGSMIIDTEPVRFFYNGKNWLITFWKGQYGMTTGAEIGVYYTEEKKICKSTLYKPVCEEDRLDMCFTLYKKDIEIMKVCAHHWWLAGFKLGMFSYPKELSMDIQIVFPNSDMLHAFLTSFEKLKHTKKEYSVYGNIFLFKYRRPRSKKIWTRTYLTDFIGQHNNRRNVKLYNKYLSDAIESKKDRLTPKNRVILNHYIPKFLKNNVENKSLPIIHPPKDGKMILLLRDDIYSTVGEYYHEK